MLENLDLGVEEDGTSLFGLSSEAHTVGVTVVLRDIRDRVVSSVHVVGVRQVVVSELDGSVRRVVVVVHVLTTSLASDESGASSGDVDTVERGSLENASGSDVEPFSADSHRAVELNARGVSSDAVEDRGGERSASQVESGVDSGEVHGLVSSVSVEEAHLVRVDNRLVLGDNGSALDEVIGLVHGSGEANRLASDVTRKVKGKLDVDDGQVHDSGLGEARHGGVAETVSLTETGELGESGSDGEDSQKLSEDGTLILDVVQVRRVEESPVLFTDGFDEARDTVIPVEARRVVSALSQVENSLVELDLTLVSLDDVVNRRVVGEVLKRVRVERDIVGKLEFSVEFSRSDTGLEVEVSVSQVSLASRKNHSGDVGVEHSLLDEVDTGEEQHGENRVDRRVNIVLSSVVGTVEGLRSAVSVVEDVVLDVRVQNESLVIHHLKLVKLGVVLRFQTEHLASLVRVAKELRHRSALELVEESELTVNIGSHGVLDEDLLLSLRVTVLGGVLQTLLDKVRDVEVTVVVVHLTHELSDRLSDLLTSLLDLLKSLLDLVFALALKGQHVVHLLEGQFSGDEVVEVAARLFTRIPLVVFSHYIISKPENFDTKNNILKCVQNRYTFDNATLNFKIYLILLVKNHTYHCALIEQTIS